MELNTFVKNFAEQFEDTDPAEIMADTRFHDLDEWSSLLGMSVIAMVRVQYGKQISGAEIRKCDTVSDLFTLVSSK